MTEAQEQLEVRSIESSELPGPADVEYFTQVQMGSWGDMLRSFARFAGLQPGWRVLDVGAGPGLLPRLYVQHGAHLAVACDGSWQMARRAASLSGDLVSVGVVVADALRLPFAPVFDAVSATNLLFLLEEVESGMAALVDVCRPGGMVACLNPTNAMGAAPAESFAAERGLTGFARFSLVNYGRLAEENHRLSPAAWCALATHAGLTEVVSETRAGGLVVFVRGWKGHR